MSNNQNELTNLIGNKQFNSSPKNKLKHNFEEIYEHLYCYPYSSGYEPMFYPNLVTTIDKVIESLSKEEPDFSLFASLNLESRIRPDAKLFLAVNFTQLILLPIQIKITQEDNPFLLNNDAFLGLKNSIYEDIRCILINAVQVSNHKNKSVHDIFSYQYSEHVTMYQHEISSHDILVAIHLAWPLLLTLRIEIWGD